MRIMWAVPDEDPQKPTELRPGAELDDAVCQPRITATLAVMTPEADENPREFPQGRVQLRRLVHGNEMGTRSHG